MWGGGAVAGAGAASWLLVGLCLQGPLCEEGLALPAWAVVSAHGLGTVELLYGEIWVSSSSSSAPAAS